MKSHWFIIFPPITLHFHSQVELVEDFALVQFNTLNVQSEERYEMINKVVETSISFSQKSASYSLEELIGSIDKANGYVHLKS